MLASSSNSGVCVPQSEPSMQEKLPSNKTRHTIGNSHHPDTMSSRKGFPCNTCDLVFQTSQAQRVHMREPWHVYNLKRRMTDLPPITADAYSEKVATNLVSMKVESSDEVSPSAAVRSSPDDESAEESNEPDHEQSGVGCCLFCTEDFDSLETNVNHMTLEHGLFLPQIEHLSSIESIISYLRTVIVEYNECLYCGVTKQSSAGVRRHMRDKEHCMINLEREPELLEFWELSDSDERQSEDEEEMSLVQAKEGETLVWRNSSQGEYTLPSGKIVGSKTKAREARLQARRPVSTNERARDPTRVLSRNPVGNINAGPSPETAGSLVESQGGVQIRPVHTRDAVGLIGVSDQQIRSLVTLQRKTQRQQAVVHASRSWAGDKGGIHQRHYKTKMNLRDG